MTCNANKQYGLYFDIWHSIWQAIYIGCTLWYKIAIGVHHKINLITMHHQKAIGIVIESLFHKQVHIIINLKSCTLIASCTTMQTVDFILTTLTLRSDSHTYNLLINSGILMQIYIFFSKLYTNSTKSVRCTQKLLI